LGRIAFMPALSYYTNVHNTALVILQQKGYRVWTRRDPERICAEKDGWDFMAHDPVQLLGVVAIHEFHRPREFREYWWKIDEPRLYDSIPSAPPDYVPVWERK
jgi:hypothetical protein